MSWFYIANTEQKGPVTDDELAVLVETGVVTAETQVWREGFAEWKLYGDVATASAVAPAGGLTLGLAGGTCSECGQSFAHEDLVKIGGRAVCGACKPTMVQQIKEGVSDDTAAEEMRRTYFRHELAVWTVGGIVFVGGGSIFVLAGALAPFSKSEGAPVSNPAVEMAVRVAVSAMIAGFGVAEIWIGLKLRKLDPRFRIPAAVIAGIGIAGGITTCIGWIVPAYILWLLVSQKGKIVFSEKYARAIEMTPHIKPRMWIVLKILLILFGVLIVLGLVAVLFGRGSGGN